MFNPNIYKPNRIMISLYDENFEFVRYFNYANNISKQYDYRIVKKVFCIDCSMYDVFSTPSLKDFIYQNFGDQVGLIQK